MQCMIVGYDGPESIKVLGICRDNQVGNTIARYEAFEASYGRYPVLEAMDLGESCPLGLQVWSVDQLEAELTALDDCIRADRIIAELKRRGYYGAAKPEYDVEDGIPY